MKYRSIFRFLLSSLLVLWILFSIHLAYRYISFVSYDTNTKTGTFVEGVNEDSTLSYLPYTSFSESNRFYQTFLFDSCLDYYFDADGKLTYEEDLCSVVSTDERNYTVTVNSGARWSDGSAITVNDVYDTYRYLLVDNVWEKQDLRVFNDVSVSQTENSVRVTFPESSPDNRIFFTHFILPVSVGQQSYDSYVSTYLSSPVWSDCASIYPQMGDDANLVFDLSTCDDTYLLRYQLKLLDVSTVAEDASFDSSFYDLLSWGEAEVDKSSNLNSFSHMRIPLREYQMLFFNTQSTKFSAKIQRALGGLVFNNFYEDAIYKDYLRRDHLGFDIFLSTGANVEKFLLAKNPTISLDKYDLEKLDITSLPQKLTLDANTDDVYFLEEVRGYKTVEVSLPAAYEGVRVTHNDGDAYTPKTYESGQQRFFYSFSFYNNNLDEGRNNYYIEVLNEDSEWEELADFDVYYLTSPLDEVNDSISEEDKIQVVYYIDDASSATVARLQNIFAEEGVDEYFVWNGFRDNSQFLGKLSSLDYDVVVGTVDVGLREDLSALFSSETPTVNPSLYSEDAFVSLLSQWTTDPQVRDAVMSVYSTDVPFLVLGQLFESAFVRSPLVSYLPVDVQGVYHFKRQLYSNVSFGAQKGFTRTDVFNTDNVRDFFSVITPSGFGIESSSDEVLSGTGGVEEGN